MIIKEASLSSIWLIIQRNAVPEKKTIKYASLPESPFQKTTLTLYLPFIKWKLAASFLFNLISHPALLRAYTAATWVILFLYACHAASRYQNDTFSKSAFLPIFYLLSATHPLDLRSGGPSTGKTSLTFCLRSIPHFKDFLALCTSFATL